jgi:hypothetical protein
MFFIFVSALFAVEPSNPAPVVLSSPSKDYTYHVLDVSNDVTYNLKPGRYKLFVRSQSASEKQIPLEAISNGKSIRQMKFRQNLSTLTKSKTNGKFVTKAQTYYFTVDKPGIKLTFKSESEVMIRLVGRNLKKDQSFPVSYEKEDILLVSGKEWEYFFTSEKKPAEYLIKGPAEVTIRSRLSYPSDLRGTQKYILNTETGKDKKSINIETKPSPTAFYQNNKNVTPSIPSTSKITLGNGNHRLKIWGNNTAVNVSITHGESR